MQTASVNRRPLSCRIGLITLVLVPVVVASNVYGWTHVGRLVGVVHAVMQTESAPKDAAPVEAARFEVKFRRPSGPPTVELQQPDVQGRSGRVACATCHSLRPPNLQNRVPSDLREFHQNIELHHGNLACYACHNPENSETLRLADGQIVEYRDVMNLCAQCHGSKMRDYLRGYHGGMTGYWDLRRGGRERNNCIDCHDPHVPKFPTMQPTFKPRDRFLKPLSHEAAHH